MVSTSQAKAKARQMGLARWMQRVLNELDKASRHLKAGPVHDLRVALRRCRSMADGLMGVDPDRDWKRMKKAAGRLLRDLGELRDMQVVMDRASELRTGNDPVGKAVFAAVHTREWRARDTAARALDEFDRKEWKAWARRLPERAEHAPLGSPIYELLALERWQEAHELHRRAMRRRSPGAFHELRIALKRFRYTVENFLPKLHAEWGADFKKLQDFLGDAHDLDLLWATARRAGGRAAARNRARWHNQIEQERKQRLAQYRDKMAGRKSLWQVWREKLPRGERLDVAALERFSAWASFLDPDFTHAQHVAHLALQLQTGLAAQGLAVDHNGRRAPLILRGAALMHDVGRAKAKGSHHKESYRLIRKLDPPPGWTVEEMKEMALVARYHQRAVPNVKQKGFRSLEEAQQKETLFLAGVLRLACTLDAYHTGSVRQVEVENEPGALVIWASGYEEEEPLASWLASSRHLLEMVCDRPVFIRGTVNCS